MQLVRPHLFAALTYDIDWADLPSSVGPAVDRFYATPGLPEDLGLLVATYRPHEGRGRVQVGCLVDAPFEPVGDVRCTCTPSGYAITATHVGPYSGIPQAHRDLGAHRNDLNLISWDVYTVWDEDENKLETEIWQLGFPRVPTLKTPRLTLEPIAIEHAAALQPQFADYEVIKYLTQGVPWPYPENGMVDFLNGFLFPRIQDGRAMAWALVHPDHGPIGLLEWRPDPSVIDDRGFWLGRAHWGQGYMTEAVIAFQDWLFFERGHDKLTVRNAVENAGSHRIKEKTGGVYRGLSACDNHEGDTAELWEVTRESWAAARGAR